MNMLKLITPVHNAVLTTAAEHMTPGFLKVVDYTLQNEGGYQNYYNDSGNWTGGEVGVGEQKGTKYGISAASFPNVDIINLTIEQAKSIYFNHYWISNNLDNVILPLAYILFDGCVNSGSWGVKFMQSVVGVTQDGGLGPITQKAIASYVSKYQTMYTAYKYQEQHLVFLSSLSSWNVDSHDFIKRNMYNMAVAASLASSEITIPTPELP